jgi:predicted ATP-binding protein involved in virulence
MKLKSLSLTNYRGFERLELELDPHINVIAGINGVGKSSILDALRVVLSRSMKRLASVTMRPVEFTDEDVLEGKKTALISCSVEHRGTLYELGVQRLDNELIEELRQKLQTVVTEIEFAEKEYGEEDDRDKRVGISEKVSSLITQRSKIETQLNDELNRFSWKVGPSRQNFDESLERLKNPQKQVNLPDSSRPLPVYFSVNRQLAQEPRTLSAKPGGVSRAFQDALNARAVNLKAFMEWYRAQLALQQEFPDEQREKLLGKLKEAALEFADFSGIKIVEEPRLRLMVQKKGVWLSTQQLSDGECGALALVFDLTRRLALANPDVSDPIAEGEAVVLIDELELHLHPSWQRQVLRRLKNMFKNCQFIVTTHSPQIIGETESKSVRFLSRDEAGKVIVWAPDQALGLDSNRVLEELMDVDSRNAGVKQDLQKLFDLIDKEKLDEAREQMAEIRKRIKGNDSELTNAESLMAFLEDAE